MTAPTPRLTHTVAQRMMFAWRNRAYTLVLAAVLPIPGALAIIYGDAVSQALSNIAAGYVSRGMGTAFLIGGVLALVGIARQRALLEVLGLTLIAAGCGIYGLGVILGLGLGGVVAGSIALAVAVATVQRVVQLTAVAPSPEAAGGGER
ncbi:MAG: hypothetical protein ACRDS0_37590 [Pseudonocardiaceae bacterium]